MNGLTEDQKRELETAVNNSGGIVAYAKQIGINKGLVSMAFNGGFVSPQIRRVMGWIRPYPSYFKCRRDDIEQVMRQVEKYHPDYEIVRRTK